MIFSLGVFAMELTDVLDKESWKELEQEIYDRSGMRPRIYDINGMGITGDGVFGNKLCAEIQSIPKAQTFICAVAHNNLAMIAKNTRNPVIEECDAGMIKIVVPIFVSDEFVGAAGGCGKVLEDGEVDTFMVNRASEIPEERVEELTTTVGITNQADMEALADFIAQRITEIVEDFQQKNGLISC
jgi:ligand-binding sensor protein